MKDVTVNPELVAYCGLYCGACRSFLKGRCAGCHDNERASWCKVRSCCTEGSYATCADCKEFTDPSECRKFHNFFSKLMSVVFNSNRRACVEKIRELGVEGYAAHMAERKLQSLPRRGE